MKVTAEDMCKKFNSDYFVGQPVWLELDNGERVETYLFTEAWVIGGHTAIAKIEGRSGGWDIKRIFHRMADC